MLTYVSTHICVFLEVFGAFYTYHLINHFQFSILIYVAIATAVNSLLFIAASKLNFLPSKQSQHPGGKGHARRYLIHGTWVLLSRILWCSAVILLHPLMTVLAEGVEGFVYFLLSVALKWRPTQDRPHPRTKFVVTFLYASAMLLIINASDVSKKENAKGEGGESTPTSSLLGLGLLMVWSVLEALRENYKRRLIHETGCEDHVHVSTAMYSLLLVMPLLLLSGSINPTPLMQIFYGPAELACIAFNVLCFTFIPSYAQLRIGEEPLEQGDLPRAPNQSVTLKRKLDTALFFTAFVSAQLFHYLYHHHPFIFVTPTLSPHHFGHVADSDTTSTGSTADNGVEPPHPASFDELMRHVTSHVDTLLLSAAFLLMAVGLKVSNMRRRSRPVLPNDTSNADHDHLLMHGLKAVKKTHTYEEAVHQVDRIEPLFESIMHASDSRKLFIFLMLNLGFMVVEIVVGLLTGSLGLVADAFHMLFDNASIGIALYAAYLSKFPANRLYNYGYSRCEVLSGFTNGILLIFVAVYIFVESLGRLFDPPEIGTENLLSVSVAGFLINLVGVLFFHEHHHHGGKCCHGHSHGESSDHPHGHSHGHCNAHPPNHSHGHSHGHCDDHPHGHSHGHSHSNGHSHGHSHDACQSHAAALNNGADHCCSATPEIHYHGHAHGHGQNQPHHHGHGTASNNGRIPQHHHHCHDQCDAHPKTEGCEKHCASHVHAEKCDADSCHSHHECHPVSDCHNCTSAIDSHSHGHGVGPPEVHRHGHGHGDICGHHKENAKAESCSHTDRPSVQMNSNIRGVYLHILADLLGSVGVIISTVLIEVGGEHSRLMIADPICSLVITILILVSSGPLIGDTANILLQRTPESMEEALNWCVEEVNRLPGVVMCYNIHFWEMKQGEDQTVGTLHVQVKMGTDHQKVLLAARKIFAGMCKHLTIQVETVGLNDLVAHDLIFSPIQPSGPGACMGDGSVYHAPHTNGNV